MSPSRLVVPLDGVVVLRSFTTKKQQLPAKTGGLSHQPKGDLDIRVPTCSSVVTGREGVQIELIFLFCFVICTVAWSRLINWLCTDHTMLH